MNFSLTPSLEQFVRDRANSGDYNNASEVIREAIRLLKRLEEQRNLKMERLRSAIRVGDEAVARGDFTDLNSGEEIDAFFNNITLSLDGDLCETSGILMVFVIPLIWTIEGVFDG